MADRPESVCQEDQLRSVVTVLACPKCHHTDVFCAAALPDWPLPCPPPPAWLHTHACRRCQYQEWFDANDDLVYFSEEPF